MKTKIFVYMLNESTDVWRPVEAEKENEFFRILTVRDIDDEEWEFETGDLVRCENKLFQSGNSELVAIQKINIGWADIEKDITNIEGSCRDINFRNVNKAELKAIYEYFVRQYELKSASDIEGEDISENIIHLDFSKIENSPNGMIRTVWKNDKLFITDIQVFSSWESIDDCFVEVTFFPQDIKKDILTLDSWTHFLKSLLMRANSKEYYLRYENASWAYGDCDPHNGVIASHNNFPIN